MSALSLPAQGAATTSAPPIGGRAGERDEKQGGVGGETVFAAVLRAVSGKEAPAPSPADGREGALDSAKVETQDGETPKESGPDELGALLSNAAPVSQSKPDDLGVRGGATLEEAGTAIGRRPDPAGKIAAVIAPATDASATTKTGVAGEATAGAAASRTLVAKSLTLQAQTSSTARLADAAATFVAAPAVNARRSPPPAYIGRQNSRSSGEAEPVGPTGAAETIRATGNASDALANRQPSTGGGSYRSAPPSAFAIAPPVAGRYAASGAGVFTDAKASDASLATRSFGATIATIQLGEAVADHSSGASLAMRSAGATIAPIQRGEPVSEQSSADNAVSDAIASANQIAQIPAADPRIQLNTAPFDPPSQETRPAKRDPTSVGAPKNASASRPIAGRPDDGSTTVASVDQSAAPSNVKAAEFVELRPESALDFAAAIAAMIAPAEPSATKPAAIQETGGAAARSGAVQTAAVVQTQSDASAPILPTDGAAAPLVVIATAIVARPVVEAHVLRARTYLGLDNLGRAVKAELAAPSGSAKDSVRQAANASASSSDQKPDAEEGAHRGSSGDAPTDDPSVVRPAVTPNVSLRGADVTATSTAFAPIAVVKLADAVADLARTIEPSKSASASLATSPTASTPVKELDIQLNPADLGGLSVKMRLANGSLAVVIEVENASTLKLIEGQHDAIVGRLASADQSVASVIIKPTEVVQSHGESGNASSSGTERQGDAQSSLAGDPQGQGRSSRGESDAPARRTDFVDEGALGRSGAGDLFV